MMFEKAAASLIAVSAMCAAAGMAVVAAGFALYAALFVRFGPAWSAALVAVAGAVVAAVLAVVLKLRADRRKLHADLMQTNIVSLLPVEVRHFIADRPIATLAISLLSGFLASRNPTLMRELVSVLHSSRRQ
jgi:dihydroxyacetone kinase